ncbi:unnamed protein product [Ambrosiozyma monospora]|uniref:Unnamed protein product n=1 Tax=Ambrosiozyma monospora TaxID=43982 RepID=A0A9W6SZM3_AMBMO|nr:unnamed protein product [Ambrosiozyma monospora]
MSCWSIFVNSHGVHIVSSRSIRVQDTSHLGQFLLIPIVSIFRVQDPCHVGQFLIIPMVCIFGVQDPSEFKIHVMLANF